MFLKRCLLGRSENYTYRGTSMQKNPIDLAIYSMLLWDVKPRTVIEIGSKDGGSAMWFADQLRGFDIQHHVYSVDINPPAKHHPCVTFLEGDASNLLLCLKKPKPWIVVEDSAHDYYTTLKVMDFFGQRLGPGDYMVIEDLHVHPVSLAVKHWLRTNPRFAIDHRYQDFWGFSDHAYMRSVG